MNYTYLLRCADDSLYCGWTNHLEQRIKMHNSGKGAKYTKSRRPVALAYFEAWNTKEEAMKREAAIKKMTKNKKEALAAELRIIISPAKKMQVRTDYLPWKNMPVFLDRTQVLKEKLQSYSEQELKKLFSANDSITHENYLRYRDMDLTRNLTPAALSYVGIQYQYMAPHLFSEEQWRYIGRHLRILSGFYGILRADDAVVPYRLEMQARLAAGGAGDLYGYWKDAIYRELYRPDGESGRRCKVLNLASKEYSKAVEPWQKPGDEFVTCIFGTLTDGKVKVKATEAKMARGEMVRFLAEQNAMGFETVKQFDRLGFSYMPELSDESRYVFIVNDKKIDVSYTKNKQGHVN